MRAGGAHRPVTAGPSPAEQRARLVRMIAADPVNVAWLRDVGARLLEREAGALTRLGDDEGAEELVRRAAAHRRGETALW